MALLIFFLSYVYLKHSNSFNDLYFDPECSALELWRGLIIILCRFSYNGHGIVKSTYDMT